jgi:hypothetical protein
MQWHLGKAREISFAGEMFRLIRSNIEWYDRQRDGETDDGLDDVEDGSQADASREETVQPEQRQT